MSNETKNTNYHKTSVGGQALIEGIMMQGPRGAAMAVRLPDKSIDVEHLEWKRCKDKFKPAGWPLIRGIFNFVETMIFGYKCMTKSAEKAGLDDGAEDPENMSKLDKWITEHFGPKMMAVVSAVALVLGFAVAFLLFFYLPTFLVDKFDEYVCHNALANIHPLFEGIMRMLIFILYMVAVSKVPDIKRVFMYHGAEHKTIFCYEHGLELTVDNVRMQKRFHPRCGTSFIFVILILSILVSSLIVVIFPGIDDVRAVWMAIKLLIVPVIVSISYEFIKYAGKHDNLFVKILSAPGLLMQRITTKEPTDDMIEVGIASLKAVITDNPEDDAL